MRNARNPFLLPALAATLCCMVVPLFKLALLEWGAPDPETALFLEQYLAGRGVLESVFDPLRNDWGFYQGRELSYFFDRLDALWIGWSARHGILHFCSLWALLFTAGSVFVQQCAIRRLMPKLPSWQAGMISLLYLLLPQSGNAVYFRSAKPGAAFCLTTAGFLLLALARAPRREKEFSLAAGAGAALFGASLFDRQGAFFAAAIATGAGAMLLAELLFFRTPETVRRRTALAAATALAATAAGTFCNLVLSPALIRFFNGYSPSGEYQQVTGLIRWETLLAGAEFLFGNLGAILTGMRNVGAAAAAFLLSAAAVAAMVRSRKPAFYFTAGCFTLLLGASWVCATGMFARHPVILHEQVMYGAYFLPTLALLIPFAALALEQVPRRAGAVILAAVTAVAVAGFALHPPEPPPGAREALRFLESYRNGTFQEEEHPVPLSLRKLAERLEP